MELEIIRTFSLCSQHAAQRLLPNAPPLMFERVYNRAEEIHAWNIVFSRIRVKMNLESNVWLVLLLHSSRSLPRSSKTPTPPPLDLFAAGDGAK
jgi:putative alpha-1,2-mannosidase